MTNHPTPWGEQFHAMSLEDQIASLKSYNASMLATNHEQAGKIEALNKEIADLKVSLDHALDIVMDKWWPPAERESI